MTRPQLSFFCELPEAALEDLFADGSVIDFLTESQSSVRMGLVDLSPGRARVVRALNRAGVAVTAWLLLPEAEGYWFNLDNAAQAARRWEQFQQWTAEEGLVWAGVGLDIEPDIHAVQAVVSDPAAGLRRLLPRLFERNRLKSGQRAYERLVAAIQSAGLPVEVYQFPFIVDERNARSSLLQRLLGLVDLPQADDEILMLYTSFLRPWGPGLLASYAPRAGGVALGSTGGGVELNGVIDVPPLTWQELRADLLTAASWHDHLLVFSLEGCARQGFFPRLLALDWSQPAALSDYTKIVGATRFFAQGALWVLSRPAWVFAALAAFWLLRRWKRQ